jgi:mono/diheme cytochrome c family protein
MRSLILGLALAAIAAPALAATAGSISAGRQTALNVCSACHVVAAKQEFEPLLVQKTPSFQEVADRPDTTAASLRRFITKTHWDEKTLPMTMPQQMLLDQQTNDVIAYILSLRKTR